MPRAFQNYAIVHVDYRSRTSSVQGLGYIKDYTQRKYHVHMLSYARYETPYYHRGDKHPVDRVLKVHVHELRLAGDLSTYVVQMLQNRTRMLQTMYGDVKSYMRSSSGQAKQEVDDYFSTKDDDSSYYNYRYGRGYVMLNHIAYVSYCVNRLKESLKDITRIYKDYPSIKYYERSEYNVW